MNVIRVELGGYPPKAESSDDENDFFSTTDDREELIEETRQLAEIQALIHEQAVSLEAPLVAAAEILTDYWNDHLNSGDHRLSTSLQFLQMLLLNADQQLAGEIRSRQHFIVTDCGD